MIIELINNNYYLIKILGKNIEVYNSDALAEITEEIYKKLSSKYHLNSLIILDFYINKMYGTIITAKDYQNFFNIDDEVEVKINIHTETPFLYKIDYFDIKNNHLENENIYYYNDNFYLEIKNKIEKEKYLNITELSELIFEESYNIINNGIKIKI